MAGSQYSRPVIVSEGAAPVTLAQISLSAGKEGSFSERWLQELVFHNPELLPIDQIDSSYDRLVPVCMELSTPSGLIDALYVTAKGRLVVVEAKLWRNHEARREVVAQILDYAQALNHWSYENLLKEVCKVTKRTGNALFDIVRERVDAVDEQAFIDGVSRCLRTSEFLLLVVGDGIREGAGAIANFLEVAGHFNFTFGLVEMSVFELGDGRRLVQPRVLAQTVLIERPRYSVPESQARGQESALEDGADEVAEALTQRESACLEFWNEFLGHLKLDDQTQPFAKAKPWGAIDFSGPPKSNAWFSAKAGTRGSDRAIVSLTFSRGPVADSIFRGLEAQREDIDQELGIPAQWSNKDGKYTVLIEKQFGGDVMLPEQRKEVFGFLSDALNRFVNAFRDRIARAVAG